MGSAWISIEDCNSRSSLSNFLTFSIIAGIMAMIAMYSRQMRAVVKKEFTFLISLAFMTFVIFNVTDYTVNYAVINLIYVCFFFYQAIEYFICSVIPAAYTAIKEA